MKLLKCMSRHITKGLGHYGVGCTRERPSLALTLLAKTLEAELMLPCTDGGGARGQAGGQAAQCSALLTPLTQGSVPPCLTCCCALWVSCASLEWAIYVLATISKQLVTRVPFRVISREAPWQPGIPIPQGAASLNPQAGLEQPQQVCSRNWDACT